MKKEIRLIIGADGAEVISGEEAKKIVKSDLVRTSAEDKVRQAVDSVVVGMGDVADVVFNVFEVFASKAASTGIQKQGKMTVSFGVTGGVNANLKLVGAKADSFITVQLEIMGSADSKDK
jgi:hypothetical protein